MQIFFTQTHTKLQSEYSREFLKTIFARLPPLASAARCGPHSPRYAPDRTGPVRVRVVEFALKPIRRRSSRDDRFSKLVVEQVRGRTRLLWA